MSRTGYGLLFPPPLLLTKSLPRCNLFEHKAEQGGQIRFKSLAEVDKVYKEMIEKECEQTLKEYLEAESRFAEVASQFVSISKAVPGQPSQVPTRPFNMGAVRKIQEAEYKVDKARKKWLASVEKLLKYYGG